MKEEKLKKCPFCGGEATLKQQTITDNKLKAFNGISTKVFCTNRGCYLKDIMDFGHDTKDSAIQAWNKRANKPSVVEIEKIILNTITNNDYCKAKEIQNLFRDFPALHICLAKAIHDWKREEV